MSNEPLSQRAVTLGDAASRRIAEWCLTLAKLSQGSIAGASEDTYLGRELRAAAVVATMAEVERLLRELLISVAKDISRTPIPIKDLTGSLRPLAANSIFQSIITSPKGENHWNHRSLVTNLADSTEIASLPDRSARSPQPPLDGRTIRESHFERVWNLLSLPGEPFPSAQASTSLNALSVLRNDIAHGNEPIEEIFHIQVAEKSSRKLLRHLQEIEKLVDHTSLNFSEYGRLRLYKNSNPSFHSANHNSISTG